MKQKDGYELSRGAYIAMAALEYFIAIMVGNNYLAYLSSAIGIPDGTIGVLSAFVSLGCGLQIVALFFKSKKRVKSLVVSVNLISQFAFTSLYFIPMIEIPSQVKTTVFIILLLMGHLLLNVIAPSKANWLRTLVQSDRLGRFAVTNETISLVTGMIFTFVMGAVADYYKAEGNMTAFFVIGGVTLLVLTLLNTVAILLMKEKPCESAIDDLLLHKRLKASFTDKATLLLLPLFVLWNFAYYATTSFFYAYALNDIGFNMTTISIMSGAYAILRSLVGFPLGAIGDKRSFVDMMSLGMLAFAIGLGFNMFGGAVNYWIYYMLFAVSMAGTNSAKTNIIFTYVPAEKRTGAIAILNTIGGFVGFFAAVIVRPLYDYVTECGNKFFIFEKVYGAQVLSALGIIITLIAIIYLNLVIKKLKKQF